MTETPNPVVPIRTSTRPLWSITRAATECGVSRETIKRRRAAGDFPNAQLDENKYWVIPVEDLLAAGLQPKMTRVNDPGHRKKDPNNDPGNDPGTGTRAPESREKELFQQVEQLRAQLDTEQRLRIAAETNADDLRINANDLRLALRMLQPGTNETTSTPTPPSEPSPSPAASAPIAPVVTPAKPLRWWNRTRA